MAVFTIKVNNESKQVDVDTDTPLLWVLRDALHLRGTKFGCGIGQCGSCTVHLNGLAIRSCSIPISSIGDGEVITIEGIDGKVKKALDNAWESLDVPQCGYCQAGQLMNASAMLSENNRPSETDVVGAMNGNICRCGTYNRIKQAIILASEQL